MKVIYIIGPFRGKNAWVIHQNVRRAEGAAMAVAELGAMPLCPHTNTQHFHGTLIDQFWLDGTMELLKRSDGAFIVPGWEESSGSALEIRTAEDLGIPTFTRLLQLRAWLLEEEAKELSR